MKQYFKLPQKLRLPATWTVVQRRSAHMIVVMMLIEFVCLYFFGPGVFIGMIVAWLMFVSLTAWLEEQDKQVEQ